MTPEKRMGEAVGRPDLDTAFDALMSVVRRELDGYDFAPGWDSIFRDTRNNQPILSPSVGSTFEISEAALKAAKVLLAFCDYQQSIGVSYFPDAGLHNSLVPWVGFGGDGA